MKALIVSGANELRIEDIAPPEIGKYDALVQIEACGICNSTDAKLIEGTMFWAPPFPVVLGHESVGTVIQVGEKVRNFCVGDRVTRPLAFWPGTRAGLNVAMGGFSEMGMVRDGRAMSADGDPSLVEDYNVQRQLVLPEDTDPVHGALAISLAETASVLLDLPPIRGKVVAIAGTGVAGLALMLWCKLAGAIVVAIGRREPRLQQAQQLGADHVVNSSATHWLESLRKICPMGVDVALDATGDVSLAKALLQVSKPGGVAVAYGVPPKGISYPSPWRNAVVEEQKCMAWVVDLLRRGWAKPEWFITHRWPLAEAVGAFDQVAKGEVLKGFVTMRATSKA